jgi:Flp pilus assembly protein TadG
MAYASASKRCQRDALAVARQGGRRALRALKAACRDCDGSALVEATVVTPLIVSLYFGVFDFSWYFYNQQLVEAGVRDAARYMARIELTNGNTNPCAQTDPGGTLYTTDAANIAVTAQTTRSAMASTPTARRA